MGGRPDAARLGGAGLQCPAVCRGRPGRRRRTPRGGDADGLGRARRPRSRRGAGSRTRRRWPRCPPRRSRPATSRCGSGSPPRSPSPSSRCSSGPSTPWCAGTSRETGTGLGPATEGSAQAETDTEASSGREHQAPRGRHHPALGLRAGGSLPDGSPARAARPGAAEPARGLRAGRRHGEHPRHQRAGGARPNPRPQRHTPGRQHLRGGGHHRQGGPARRRRRRRGPREARRRGAGPALRPAVGQDPGRAARRARPRRRCASTARPTSRSRSRPVSSPRRALSLLERPADFPGVGVQARAGPRLPAPGPGQRGHVLGYLARASAEDVEAAKGDRRRHRPGGPVRARAAVRHASCAARPGARPWPSTRAASSPGPLSGSRPVPGRDVGTHLDLRVQTAAEKALAEAVSTARSRG